jgi:chromosome segregation ATPase
MMQIGWINVAISAPDFCGWHCYNKKAMSDDQFTRLFKYMQKRFDNVDKQLEKNEHEHADMRGSMAELSAEVRDYRNEVLVMGHQVSQHAGAIAQLATATGVKLDFEL